MLPVPAACLLPPCIGHATPHSTHSVRQSSGKNLLTHAPKSPRGRGLGRGSGLGLRTALALSLSHFCSATACEHVSWQQDLEFKVWACCLGSHPHVRLSGALCPFRSLNRRKGYCTLTGDKLCLRPPLQDTSRCLAGQTRSPHAHAVTSHPVAAPAADQTSCLNGVGPRLFSALLSQGSAPSTCLISTYVAVVQGSSEG